MLGYYRSKCIAALKDSLPELHLDPTKFKRVSSMRERRGRSEREGGEGEGEERELICVRRELIYV